MRLLLLLSASLGIGELVNLKKEHVSIFYSWSVVASDSKALTFKVKKLPLTASFTFLKPRLGLTSSRNSPMLLFALCWLGCCE